MSRKHLGQCVKPYLLAAVIMLGQRGQSNPSRRTLQNEHISAKVKALHAHRHKKAYGSP